MTTARPDRPTVARRRWAWVLAGGVAAGAGVIALVMGSEPALEPTPTGAWVAVALFTALAERHRVHLRVGRETLGLSLAEVPTMVALFLLPPAFVVLARGVGVGVTQLGVHRREPLKLLVNVAIGVLEAAVSALAFRFVLVHVGGDSWATYAGALVAIMGGCVVGYAVLEGVFWVVGNARTVRQQARSMGVGLAVALGNASMGLFLTALWRTRPDLAWIGLLPFAILVVSYRAYIGLWRHRDALEFIYDTAVQTQSRIEANEALGVIVRRTREQLRARQAELFAIGAPQGHVDGGTKVTVFSAAPGAVEEVRTTALRDLPPEVRDRIAHEPSDGGVTTDEVWVRADGTSSGTVLLRVAGPGGQPAAFDATDLEVVRSLSRLATSALDRAELAELKAAFLSAVSHELRTPLTVVVGTAATLRARGAALPPEQQSLLLERLEDQAHRLDRLLSDLLDLDRLNRGVLEPRRHLVDLVPLVDRVLRALDVHSHTVQVLTDTLVAEVDPGLTERIVENLVKNAVKYSPAGTTIRVDLRRTDDEIVVSVEDEGAGIPLELRSRILEPFTRVDHDHPQPGTGIGLSLVRRFAQVQGGDAWVEDGRTGGTRVVVVLQDVRVPDVESGRLLTT